MFSSRILKKGSRFFSPVLGKGSIGSLVQYWKKMFYRFPSPVLEKVLCLPNSNTGKRFYRFSSPILLKVFGSPNQYLDRFYRFSRPVLGKGSIVTPVQYWEKF